MDGLVGEMVHLRRYIRPTVRFVAELEQRKYVARYHRGRVKISQRACQNIARQESLVHSHAFTRIIYGHFRHETDIYSSTI